MLDFRNFNEVFLISRFSFGYIADMYQVIAEDTCVVLDLLPIPLIFYYMLC